MNTVPHRPVHTSSSTTTTTTTRPRASRPGRRAAVLAVTSLAACGVAATSAQAVTTVTALDSRSPVASAANEGTAAWLRPTEKYRSSSNAKPPRSELVVLDPGTDAPRTVSITVPSGVDGLTLGTDKAGKRVALLHGPKGIYQVALQGTASLKRVPGSSPFAVAAIQRGRVAWVRTKKGRERAYTAARFGAKPREAFVVPPKYGVDDLALGKDGVVFVKAGRGVDNGISDIVWRARAGGNAKRITTQSTGGASDNGMGPLAITNGGTRVNVSRWNDGGGHASDLAVYRVSSGRKVSSRSTTSFQYADAVIENTLMGAGRRSFAVAAATSGCEDPSTPGTSSSTNPPCVSVALINR